MLSQTVCFSDCFVHCGVNKASVKRTQMDLDLFMLYLLTEIEKRRFLEIIIIIIIILFSFEHQ